MKHARLRSVAHARKKNLGSRAAMTVGERKWGKTASRKCAVRLLLRRRTEAGVNVREYRK